MAHCMNGCGTDRVVQKDKAGSFRALAPIDKREITRPCKACRRWVKERREI